ncbi:MAG TPA: short-chain dehydrogenase [Alphaproteobacteria bacterium]|jgi:NAD(P)-dependent dehydrogenase (short-subunit alcohol dehydrogenase family)|nr:MAG: short-chain dehydrogenase [SAR116 cluster bacterium MED-G06]HBP60592.1 short-chain dehydrogenase [Alphaproteobacteria bacterium]HCV88292.1 short-chain dehydrogenase [Alphaproteobacteria bacterium]|tara:strand:- start:1492 stop:2274 length:783 start_codon:yes stop_codon:yes gene_type:complete
MIDNSTTSVLISGGTQGLGFAVAECMIRQGCSKITITGRNTERGEAAAEALRAAGADCLFVTCDVAKVEDCETAVAMAIDHHGLVNGLVNCAADTSRGSLVDTTPELWARHMDINLRGPFLLMQGVVRHLLETGRRGSMVNILSTSAHVGQSFLTPYATSKGGLQTLTLNAANAYRSDLIRCNAVAPGWMDTPGEDVVQKKFHDAPDDWLEKAEAELPMGQLVKTHQIAPLIAYLLSPDSGIITGSVINYDQHIIGAVPE